MCKIPEKELAAADQTALHEFRLELSQHDVAAAKDGSADAIKSAKRVNTKERQEKGTTRRRVCECKRFWICDTHTFRLNLVWYLRGTLTTER